MWLITLLIALYGALLSTIGILWQIRVWWQRTRGRVKVLVKDGWLTVSPVRGSTGPWMVFEAVNDGEKPVTLSTLSVTVKGTKKAVLVLCPELPRTLKEGEAFAHLLDRKEFISRLAGLGLSPPWKCRVSFRSNAERDYRRWITVRR